jgi:hypothetical protein
MVWMQQPKPGKYEARGLLKRRFAVTRDEAGSESWRGRRIGGVNVEREVDVSSLLVVSVTHGSGRERLVGAPT